MSTILDFQDFKQVVGIKQMSQEDPERDEQLVTLYNHYLQMEPEERDAVVGVETKAVLRKLCRALGVTVI